MTPDAKKTIGESSPAAESHPARPPLPGRTTGAASSPSKSGPSAADVVAHIVASGLARREAVEPFLPSAGSTEAGSGKQLIEELVRQKRLTRFQAEALCQEKQRPLVLGNYVILDLLGKGDVANCGLNRDPRPWQSVELPHRVRLVVAHVPATHKVGILVP
jgi:hypothetical protein